MASENDCAAPQRYVRQSPALIHEYSLDSMQPRRRRRGPRSYLARLRRSIPSRCRSLPGTAPGKSGASVPDFACKFSPQFSMDTDHGDLYKKSSCDDVINKKEKSEIIIYSQNIRCLRANLAELIAQLQIVQPHIVCLQETWLDLSIEQM